MLDQSEKLGGRPVASSSNCPFRKFINQPSLIDLGFVGNPFTWCNNKNGPATIKQRLDKGLASLSWVHLHCGYFIIHIPAFDSDHNHITLNTTTPSPFLPRPFRFEEFWTKDHTCRMVRKNAWSPLVSGSPAYFLVKKSKKTKTTLKRWNSTHFGHI